MKLNKLSKRSANVGPNALTLDRTLLKELGDLVYPGGGSELLEFLQLTVDKKPFPV